MNFEFIKGVVSVLELYPDAVLSGVCSAAYGIATKEEFFPSLAKLKSYCELEAKDVAVRERWMKMASRKPAPQITHHGPPQGVYTGPIEEVRPGDILTFDRLSEYDAFMKANKGMPSVRHWGFNENWVDSGQRPFQLSVKHDVTPVTPPEPNPFDPPTPRPEPSPPEKTPGQA